MKRTSQPMVQPYSTRTIPIWVAGFYSTQVQIVSSEMRTSCLMISGSQPWWLVGRNVRQVLLRILRMIQIVLHVVSALKYAPTLVALLLERQPVSLRFS